MIDFDIVIPHVRRNTGLLARNLPLIRRHIGGRRIFILAALETLEELERMRLGTVTLCDEDKVLPGLTLAGVRSRVVSLGVPPTRAGWYFQQFLKMAWALNPQCGELYLTWDSDTFPLRPLRFFDEAGHRILRTTEQYHGPYFESLERLVGIGKLVEESFIAESMIIDRPLMIELLSEIAQGGGLDKERFFDRILDVAAQSSNPYTAFSEFETYGNFVLSRRRGNFELRPSRNFRNAAKYFGLRPSGRDLARLARRHEIASFERWNTRIPPFIAFQKFLSLLVSPRTKDHAHENR